MSRRGWILVVVLLLIVPTLAMAQSPGPQNDGRYMVKFKDFRGASDVVRAAGGTVALELVPQSVIAAYLPAAAIAGLQHNPNVEYIEVDPRRYPMSQTIPYGITMVQAPQVSASNAGACMVCIIDSGYYRAHEDLQDSNVTGDNDSGTGNWYEDTCGHGSHVAGTVSALDNTVGVVGVMGNNAINLQIEKVFDGSNCQWSYSSTLVNALNKCRTAATSAGKNLVVSMSLGGGAPSSTEDSAFQNAYNNNVLSVAAAGNGGNTAVSYPAGYSSVISVAAVDSTKTVASFSQHNSDVELAAPGVGVLSTVPFAPVDVTVNGTQYLGANIDGSARTNATGALADGSLCTSTGAWSGKVVLCQRGTNTFADKVTNVKNSGGVAAVIYNNVSGNFSGTLNGTSTIPAISISMEDGQTLTTLFGQSATVHNTAGTGSGYESWDGTSMATPHVSGVAALVWSNYPTRTNADIRTALQNSAQDLGAAGRDNYYGYGLVQAKAAYDLLASGPPPPPPPAGITLTVTKTKVKKTSYANLSWSGATTTNVNINRNGSLYVVTPNDGAYRDGPMSRGTYTYQVCTTDATPVCSNTVSVRF